MRRRRLPIKWRDYEGEVRKIARLLADSKEEYKDLIGEGALAFVQARHSFDPNKGSFSTHLWWQAMGAMQSYKRSNAKTPHLDCDVPEGIYGRVGPMQEKQCSFMETLQGLSKEALDVVRIIFEGPAEMLGYTKSHGLSIRSLTTYLAKERGWKYQDIWDATAEITKKLKGEM